MKTPKVVRLLQQEKAAEYMRFMGERQSHIDRGIIAKAYVPADLDKRLELAHSLASGYARRNKSDPFAYDRCHAAVVNGWIGAQDFEKGDPSI